MHNVVWGCAEILPFVESTLIFEKVTLNAVVLFTFSAENPKKHQAIPVTFFANFFSLNKNKYIYTRA